MKLIITDVTTFTTLYSKEETNQDIDFIVGKIKDHGFNAKFRKYEFVNEGVVKFDNSKSELQFLISVK